MATELPNVKDTMNREFARMSGLLYDLNPRNFEDRWYALVGIELNLLCRKIKCNAIATAQDSIWAGNTYSDPIKLANVMVPPDTVAAPSEAQKRAFLYDSKAGEGFMDTVDEDTEDTDAMAGNPGLDLPDTTLFKNGSISSANPQGQEIAPAVSQTQHEVAPSASQEMNGGAQGANNTANSQQGGSQSTSQQPSASACTITGGNSHRVPDSAINGFVSIDFTYEAMKEAIATRQGWTTQDTAPESVNPVAGAAQPDETSTSISSHSRHAGEHASQESKQEEQSKSDRKPVFQVMNSTTESIHDELKKLPPTDPEDHDALRNPYPIYRGRKVVEFKLVNAESKRLPSRLESEEKPPWDGALLDLMSLAQCGNLEQIRVFFASPQWNHQDSVLLLATAGDFQTYTIATRAKDQATATFSILPWSSPVWFGSEACKRREEKILDWINTTYSPEAMMKIALRLRDEAAARPQPTREKTPPEGGNSDRGNGPSGSLGAAVPSDSSAAPTTGKRKRNRNKLKGTEPTRISSRIREGKALGESVAEKEHTDAPPPPSHIPDAEQVSSADEERLALDNARDGDAAQPGASAALPGDNVPGTSKPKDKGKGKARADPIVESDQDSDDNGSPLSPVLEAEEGSDSSDDDRPAHKKARTELPPEGPPSTCPPSPIENDVQPARFASTQPTASTSTQPAAMSTQPAASTSTQPAASSSNQQSLERRRSARAPRPVQPFDAKGKKDAEKNRVKRLKRARTIPH